jgi:hypothetical protein
MLCMKYVEIQAHKVYEMYNKNKIFLKCWLMVYWYAITYMASCAYHVCDLLYFRWLSTNNYVRFPTNSDFQKLLPCAKAIEFAHDSGLKSCANSYLSHMIKKHLLGRLRRTPMHSDGFVNHVRWDDLAICKGLICTSVLCGVVVHVGPVENMEKDIVRTLIRLEPLVEPCFGMNECLYHCNHVISLH